MLCSLIMVNNNIMIAYKTIKYVPAKAVLKYEIGDQIKLNEDDFVQISKALFLKWKLNY